MPLCSFQPILLEIRLYFAYLESVSVHLYTKKRETVLSSEVLWRITAQGGGRWKEMSVGA